jgi:hypothetical protein
MKTHRITGGGGVQLHVVETGTLRVVRLSSSTAPRSVGSSGVGR